MSQKEQHNVSLMHVKSGNKTSVSLSLQTLARMSGHAVPSHEFSH